MVSLCSEFEVSSLTRCKGRKTTQNLQNGGLKGLVKVIGIWYCSVDHIPLPISLYSNCVCLVPLLSFRETIGRKLPMFPAHRCLAPLLWVTALEFDHVVRRDRTRVCMLVCTVDCFMTDSAI